MDDKVIEEIHRKALEAYFKELSKGMTEHFMQSMTKPYTDMLNKFVPTADMFDIYKFGKGK